jgi:phosphoglycerol geranylgeranyltransferase
MSVIFKLTEICQSSQKRLVLLIDPDNSNDQIREVTENALLNGIEWFLVGGSLLTNGNTSECVRLLKSLGAPNVVLFPGHEIQIVKDADALLFMSLISGRNPEFLIGKHVNVAPWIKKAGLETIPTGYMLVESGKMTSALYMSQTIPLPSDKPDIAAATALAGEMLGLKVFYLDAGSGASKPVNEAIVTRVKETINGALFVGGGITTAEKATAIWMAGADFVVIGNGVFSDIAILSKMSDVCRKLNTLPTIV